MRLIDADELKREITKKTYNFAQIQIRVDRVQEIIDNAPTIKTFTLLDIEENFNKGLNIGLSYAPEDRPHGKWIYKCCCGDEFPQCSVCGEINDVKSRFCPDCGADMRGEDHD